MNNKDEFINKYFDSSCPLFNEYQNIERTDRDQFYQELLQLIRDYNN